MFSDRYPTLSITNPDNVSISSPVGRATTAADRLVLLETAGVVGGLGAGDGGGAGGASSELIDHRMRLTSPVDESGRNAIGLFRNPNSNTLLEGLILLRSTPLSINPKSRFLALSPCCSTMLLASSINALSIPAYSTPSRFNISLNSLVVKATWAGPRRPTA
jgi:hypothetical protein